MRHLPLIALLGACTPAEESPWLLEEADLGDDIAADSGYSLQGGETAWLAAAQILPDQLWENPGYELPLAIWEEIVDDQSIADEGSCPYVIAEGPTLTWVSNCRSQEGYDWSGTVSRTDGEQDGRSTELWELDLEIIADTDFPRFSRVMMSGSVLIFEAGGELAEGVQANLITAVEDFEEVAQGDAAQKEIWSVGWALSARHEEHADGTLLLEGATELGDRGGLSFSGMALSIDDKCPGEPDGQLTLTAGAVATLDMDGVSGMCDSCAALTLDGVSMGEVCRY
jgi:hypothetical protein